MIMVSLMGAFILIFLHQLFESGFFFKFDQTVEYNSVSFLPLLYISRLCPLMQKVKMNQVGKFMVSALRVKSPSFYDFQKSDFTSD